MHNDSIETLLLRHYGSTAPTPSGLEQRLCASLQNEIAQQRLQYRVATRLRKHHVSRRKAVQFVAVGSASLGILSIGLEALQALETSILGLEATQSAFP